MDKLNVKYIVVFFVVGILAVVGIAVSTFDEKSSSGDLPSDVGEIVVDEPNEIQVENQVSGSVVVVPMVELANGGFVIVYEDGGGLPGANIGASSLLDSGTHQDVVVNLDRESVPGELLWAVVHYDNGDGLPAGGDEFIRDSEGKVVNGSFEIISQ